MSFSAVWVIIPAYNEATRIRGVLRDIATGGTWQVVVIDDCSTDGTAQMAIESGVTVLRHKVNLGQGAALQTGISYALMHGADAIVTFDADGQHVVTDIYRLLEALESKHADFALGSRFLGTTVGIPLLRKLLLKAAVAFTAVHTGALLTDAHNGIRAMTAAGASRLSITMNRMEHASQIIEQIVASGLTYVEVPVTIHYTLDTLAKGQRSSTALRMGTHLLLRKLLG